MQAPLVSALHARWSGTLPSVAFTHGLLRGAQQLIFGVSSKDFIGLNYGPSTNAREMQHAAVVADMGVIYPTWLQGSPIDGVTILASFPSLFTA
jgi:hypothetical protein